MTLGSVADAVLHRGTAPLALLGPRGVASNPIGWAQDYLQGCGRDSA